MTEVGIIHVATLDMTTPPEVTSYIPNGMWVSGNKAFISSSASGANWELLVVDISNPAAPVQLTGYSHPSGLGAFGVWTDGVVCCYTTNGPLMIVDATTDPPTLLGTEGTVAGQQDIVGMDAGLNYLVVTIPSVSSIATYNITVPAAPVHLSTVALGVGVPALASPQATPIPYFYALELPYSYTWWTYTDKGAPPVRTGSFAMAGSPKDLFSTTGEGGIGAGTYTYVVAGSGGYNTALQVWEGDFTPRGSTSSGLVSPSKMYVGNGYAAVLDGTRILLYDVSDSDNPYLAGSINSVLTNPTAIFGKDNYLFVADNGNKTFEVFEYDAIYASSSSSTFSSSSSSTLSLSSFSSLSSSSSSSELYSASTSSSSTSSFEDFPTFLGPQSIVYDHVRSRCWWVDDAKVYMLDNLNKQVNSFEMSGYQNAAAVEVEYSTGNAFVVAEQISSSERHIIQVFRDNNKVLGVSKLER